MSTSAVDPRSERARFVRAFDRDDRARAEQQLQSLGHDMSRRSVIDFQRRARIKVDGIVGPETAGALGRAAVERDRSAIEPGLRVTGERRAPTDTDRRRLEPGATRAGDLRLRDEQRRRATVADVREPPPNASERERFNHYAAIVRANGGQVNPGGQPTVLGLRARNGVTRGFEDRFVVLTPDGRAREFTGTTRPGNTTQRNGGVAQLSPGNYSVVPNGPHYGRPSYHVRTLDGSGRVPAIRDSNGDGQYSAREQATPRTATAILFHVPNPRYGDRIPTTIGCMNIRNRDWDAFMRAVGGPSGRFNFTLVGP